MRWFLIDNRHCQILVASTLTVSFPNSAVWTTDVDKHSPPTLTLHILNVSTVLCFMIENIDVIF